MLCLLLSGCSKHEDPLVKADSERIFKIARKAVKTEHPDVDLADFHDFSIEYVERASYDQTPYVEVHFLSRQVYDVYERAPTFRTYVHSAFVVGLSNEGTPSYVNAECGPVASSDPNYLFNNGLEFVGTNAPKTQP